MTGSSGLGLRESRHDRHRGAARKGGRIREAAKWPQGRKAMPPRFAVGSHVNVRRGNPPGHIRTPYYIRGKAGTVERICGEFRNPEELAYGRTGQPTQLLYLVRFVQKDVWRENSRPRAGPVDVC